MKRGAGHSTRNVRRSREAIIATFNGLVLNGRYKRLGIRELVRRAGVARSTFYEHFDDKTALLIESMYPLLSVLAEAACGMDEPRLTWVLDHMEQQRENALTLFAASVERQAIETGLARLIAQHVPKTGTALPRDDIASTLARTTIGLIGDWLAREARSPSRIMANVMRDGLAALKASICA